MNRTAIGSSASLVHRVGPSSSQIPFHPENYTTGISGKKMISTGAETRDDYYTSLTLRFNMSDLEPNPARLPQAASLRSLMQIN